MNNKTLDPPSTGNRPWQPRFGILGLLLLTLVVCGMASGGYYFVRMLSGGRSDQLAFIVFTISSPILLLVLVSCSVAILKRTGRSRRR